MNEIPAEKIFLITGSTDMRRSICSLSVLIQQTYKEDPFSKSMYLFCGRGNDKLKAIIWEGDGWLLLYKRLENKGRFNWPRSASEARQITRQQLRWLLEGLNIDQPKAIQKAASLQII